MVSRIDPAGGVNLPSGKTIEYRYDDAGNVVEVKTAAGTMVSGYDAQNRLSTVTDAGKQTQYIYDEAGNLAQTRLPNGVVLKRIYDDLNRLVVVENVRGTEVLSKFEYTLDDAGNRSEVRESVRDAVTGELVVRTVRYEYDDLYRLSSETVLDAVGTVTRQVSYAYDDVGNRTVLSESGVGTTTYQYDRNDRLLSESGVTNATYTYDDNGNTLSVTQGGQTTSYTCDNRNRMTQVISPTGTTVYGYNDENIRVSSQVGGQTTHFLLDSNRDYSQVLAESRGGTVQASYVYGLDLVSQKRGGTESFYLVDGLGSTRGLTNASGSLTDSYSYDAFRNLVGSAGSTSNSYLFAGEQLDAATGDYYLRQRFYDVGTGRFTRRDSYEGNTFEPITLNKYVYGNANPVSYIDPSGLIAVPGEGSAVSSILGILAALPLISTIVTADTHQEDSKKRTFFRGTSYYDYMETIATQHIDLERVINSQSRYGYTIERQGVYFTGQFSTAEYYASYVSRGGKRGGPGIITATVPEKLFNIFALKYGIVVEAPVPDPPAPGQTETIIPYNAMPEFEAFSVYT